MGALPYFFMLKFKLFSVQLLSKLNDGKSISAENNFYKNHSISSIIVAKYCFALTLRVVPIRIRPLYIKTMLSKISSGSSKDVILLKEILNKCKLMT